MDIIDRIESRIHDSDMEIEHLLEDCAAEIKRLRVELEEAQLGLIWAEMAAA